MKVIAINGSPKKEGNTFHALKLVADALDNEDIETEIVHIGNKTIKGCIACGKCAENRDEKCIIDDAVNEVVQKIKTADGILLGSPVYYSGIAGTMKSFLDRMFQVAVANDMLRYKAGASVAAVRRSGGIPTFHQLNNYLTFAEMVMPGSNYWNVIHGTMPGEVTRDDEGVQIMKVLGRNMAWLLKTIDHGKAAVARPPREDKVFTNFVRE